MDFIYLDYVGRGGGVGRGMEREGKGNGRNGWFVLLGCGCGLPASWERGKKKEDQAGYKESSTRMNGLWICAAQFIRDEWTS